MKLAGIKQEFSNNAITDFISYPKRYYQDLRNILNRRGDKPYEVSSELKFQAAMSVYFAAGGAMLCSVTDLNALTIPLGAALGGGYASPLINTFLERSTLANLFNGKSLLKKEPDPTILPGELTIFPSLSGQNTPTQQATNEI